MDFCRAPSDGSRARVDDHRRHTVITDSQVGGEGNVCDHRPRLAAIQAPLQSLAAGPQPDDLGIVRINGDGFQVVTGIMGDLAIHVVDLGPGLACVRTAIDPGFAGHIHNHGLTWIEGKAGGFAQAAVAQAKAGTEQYTAPPIRCIGSAQKGAADITAQRNPVRGGRVEVHRHEIATAADRNPTPFVVSGR